MNPSLNMKKSINAVIAVFVLSALDAYAQTPGPRQSQTDIRQVVEHFLLTQSTGLPGQASVKVGRIDPRLNLPACAAPEPFLPNGSRAWGKTTVGVRCTVPSPWTIYVPATVQIIGEYIATATSLTQGQNVGSANITKVTGDLAALPAGIVTDASMVIGRTTTISLPAGVPLRLDTLRSQQAVLQGQTIRVMSRGPGFQVSSEARALNNAAEGQVAQARTPGGQVVSGIAKTGGILEVTY